MKPRLTRRAFLGAGVAAAALAACRPASRAMTTASNPYQADFYAAPDGDDAWSGRLPRPNAARSDGPFATLDRAQEAVRELARRQPARDIRVLIRAGAYYLPSGMTFGVEDSGAEGGSAVYAGYPGEHPALAGGVRLTGWRRLRGELWEADLPDGAAPEQVFENGARMRLARAPKQGYFLTQDALAGRPRTGFVYKAEDLDALDPGAWDLAGVKVTIWPTYNWFNFVKPVATLDPQARAIVLRGEDGYDITRGNRYAVLNALALLTEPGECVIDPAARKVIIHPSRTPVEEQAYVIPTAPHVLRIRGNGRTAPARRLRFEGLDLGISNDDAVRITAAEDCELRFCLIENGGGSGARVTGPARRVTVYGCLIREHGYCGVSLEGLEPGQPDANGDHRVENNHIHHCGRLVGHGAGVYLQQSGRNQVLHNHIHHLPRYGTTIKGLRYQVLREQVAGVTWDNHYDFLHSRGNRIAYNDIHHANLDSQDTGAMESWGPGRDNVYDHNLVHDCGNAEFDLQSGMYLDDATDHFTVTNNIIWGIAGTSGNQPIFAKGIGNRFDNNILVAGETNEAAITSMEMAGEACRDHAYTRNVIVLGRVQGAVYKFITWSEGRIAASDYNLIWKPEGNVFCLGTPGAGVARWDEWRATGLDAHSALGDPLFAGYERGDFRLRAGSPALALGFQPIDAREIGLKADFPERFERA
jgi:hypothetical protein